MKKSWCFLIVIAALVSLAVPAAAGDFNLDSLLVVSIGGPGALESLKQVTSVYTAGSVNLNGLEGTFEQYFVAPDRFHLRIDFVGFGLVQAYDGQIAWQRDHNGQVSELLGFEKRELLKNLYFESSSYLFDDRLPGGKEYRGQVSVDSRTYHEVAFYPFHSDTVQAYYNPQTGLRELMIARLDNVTATTSVSDYREVESILVPFYSRAVMPQAGLFSEFVLDSIVVNLPVDPSIFAAPASGVVDYRFPAGATFVEIPIDYDAGHIRLQAVVNGEAKAWFILDSGSSANILHQPLVERLGLPAIGTVTARGLTGFDEVELVRTDSITIGRLTLYDQVAGSLDLSLLGSARASSDEFGGLLGYDFLSRFPVMISYHDSTLIVFNPDSFDPPEGGAGVAFHLTMRVPTVRAELNGIPGDFILDLGNPFGLIIHRSFAVQHQLEKKLDDIRETPRELGGIGGGLSGHTAFAATFKIGDVLIQSLRVILPDSSTGLAGSQELAGNIGNMILENFDILLDYRHGRLVLYDADR